MEAVLGCMLVLFEKVRELFEELQPGHPDALAVGHSAKRAPPTAFRTGN
jgi:hypothetical protein